MDFLVLVMDSEGFLVLEVKKNYFRNEYIIVRNKKKQTMKKLILIPMVLLGLISCKKEEIIQPENNIRKMAIYNGYIIQMGGDSVIGLIRGECYMMKGTSIRAYPYGCGILEDVNGDGINEVSGGAPTCSMDIDVENVGRYTITTQAQYWSTNPYQEWIVP